MKDFVTKFVFIFTCPPVKAPKETLTARGLRQFETQALVSLEMCCEASFRFVLHVISRLRSSCLVRQRSQRDETRSQVASLGGVRGQFLASLLWLRLRDFRVRRLARTLGGLEFGLDAICRILGVFARNSENCPPG